MAAIDDIKRGIVRKIAAVSSVNKVYDYEKVNPDGFPAAFVTFQGTENEFFTNAENKRIFAYRILILCQIGQDASNTEALEQAELTIQQITGDILDTMDSDITLDNNAEVIFVEAAVGQPGYVNYEGGMARSSEIILKIHSIYLV